MNDGGFYGPYQDECMAHFVTRKEYHEVLSALKSLMAVINRDGGHRADLAADVFDAATDCENVVRELHHIKEKYDALTKT